VAKVEGVRVFLCDGDGAGIDVSNQSQKIIEIMAYSFSRFVSAVSAIFSLGQRGLLYECCDDVSRFLFFFSLLVIKSLSGTGFAEPL
jgi:hypothetical protein